MNEKDWILKNCKFAQGEPPVPAVPQQPQVREEDIYFKSLENLKIVSKKGDSEVERQYHDDPTAFEPGTIAGGLYETYWHELRLQGKIYWNQNVQESFSEEGLEEAIKESILQERPSSISDLLTGDYKIEFSGVTATPVEPNWYMVTMDLTIEGEQDVDPPEPDYDAYEDRRNGYGY
jgi:hypothetical protein